MSEQHAPDKFEQTDWDVKPVVITVAVLYAFLILGIILGGLTERFVNRNVDRHDDTVVFHDTKALPPAPRLQVDEAGDLKDFRDKEDALLSSYDYTDRSKTAIRIPIDRAIDLTASEGLGGRR